MFQTLKRAGWMPGGIIFPVDDRGRRPGDDGSEMEIETNVN